MGRLSNDQKRRQKIAKSLSKMTPDVLQRLEDAFVMDCNVPQACLYAGIGESTYYEWVKRNDGLAERFKTLRQSLTLKARKIIAERMTSYDEAMRYMVKKQPDEYGDKTQIEHSGKIQTEPVSDEAGRVIADKFEKELRETIVAGRKNTNQKTP